MMLRRFVLPGKFLFPQVRSFASNDRHGTTVLCVRKLGKVVMASDGQVTAGNVIIKPNVKKVRLLSKNILVGFAGSTADALTLVELLEEKLSKYPDQLMRSCVELAKSWRTDKYLRKLDASLLVADANHIFEVTGNGDVLEPYHSCMGMGSGGNYAQAAALALIDIPDIDAELVVRKSMKIAGDMCIYTNNNLTLLKIDAAPEGETPPDLKTLEGSLGLTQT